MEEKKEGLLGEFEELFNVFCLILSIITLAGSLIVFASKAPWIPPRWSAVIIIGLGTSAAYLWSFTKKKVTLSLIVGLLLFAEWGALFALFKLGLLK